MHWHRSQYICICSLSFFSQRKRKTWFVCLFPTRLEFDWALMLPVFLTSSKKNCCFVLHRDRGGTHKNLKQILCDQIFKYREITMCAIINN